MGLWSESVASELIAIALDTAAKFSDPSIKAICLVGKSTEFFDRRVVNAPVSKTAGFLLG